VQYSVGYFQNFAKNMFEASVEVYYKDLYNQIDYTENYVPDLGQNQEAQFVFGKGRAYGLELFLKKRFGKFNGFIGYTLSRSERNFDDINKGVTFPTKFDRTHDINIVANYSLGKKWEFGGAFVFGTGSAFTQVERFYQVGFNLYQDYGARNGARIQDYHRIDLSATYTPSAGKNKNFESSWNFSIYNVYNRKNTYFNYYDIQTDPNVGSTEIKYLKVSLFPIIPSVTWNFKWKQSPKK
jgi:hypothetical protein